MNKNRATLIGLIAVLLWSSIIGLMREVSERFGAVGGAALIYSVAAVFLLLSIGFTHIKALPRKYLFWGALLFVAYELSLSLSIGFANTGRQAIEVSMLNYLWPTLTIIAAILFNRQRTNLLIIPGFFLSMMGIGWILGGEQGLSFAEMWRNVQSNPLSYGLALFGALIWAAYCIVTARIAEGHSGITLFFVLVAAVLWIKYLFSNSESMDFSYHSLLYLVLASAAMGFGYAAWNVGVLYGNVTILAGASYFIPVFSAAIAATLLNTSLAITFWQGAAMVCLGSIFCWLATRKTGVK